MEEQISMDTKNINHAPTVKQVMCLVVVLLLCATAFVFLCMWEDGRVTTVHVAEVSDAPLHFEMGEVSVGKYIEFQNCVAYLEGESIVSWDLKLLLRSQQDGSTVAIPTYMVTPGEGKDHVTPPVNEYNRGVFGANVKNTKLKLSQTDYDVLLYYNHNGDNLFFETGYVLTQKGITNE